MSSSTIPSIHALGCSLSSLHAHGTDCVWHGPASEAISVDDHGELPNEGTLRCPHCNGPVTPVIPEAFWADVRRASLTITSFEQMLMWSEGKCFPDYSTLENVWHQAITE